MIPGEGSVQTLSLQLPPLSCSLNLSKTGVLLPVLRSWACGAAEQSLLPVSHTRDSGVWETWDGEGATGACSSPFFLVSTAPFPDQSHHDLWKVLEFFPQLHSS